MNEWLETHTQDHEIRYYRAMILKHTGESSKARNDFKILKEIGYSDSEEQYNQLAKKK
jgi:hypothetical protein